MPYDSNGVFSLVPGYLAVTGQTIMASQHNPPFEDIAAALSQVLLRSGNSPMAGIFNFNSFKGINLANGSSPTDAVNKSQIDNLSPVGIVSAFAGATAPAGWLLCFGQAISRTSYAALFTALGTTYGVGDGTTTFNLPDYRGRVLAGADNMGGTLANRLTAASGWTAGATIPNAQGSEVHTLTAAQMPVHGHGVNDPSHQHLFTRPAMVGGTGRGANPANFDVQIIQQALTEGALTGISIQNAGGDGAHNNVQPTIITNYIIRTGV